MRDWSGEIGRRGECSRPRFLRFSYGQHWAGRLDSRGLPPAFSPSLSVILFGVAMLGDSITAVGVLGVLLAIGGGLWYARARARMQELTDLVGDTKRDAESQKDQEMSEALLHSGGKRDEGEDHAARRV